MFNGSTESRSASVVRFASALGLLLVVATSWSLAAPRSAGPDEPSHSVEAAALVRGQFDGVEYFENFNRRGYELPAHIGFPDPGCYAFHPTQPASCLDDDFPSGVALLGTRSSDYPAWGLLIPGLGSFAPARSAGYVMRVLSALLPVVLIAAALRVAARRGPFVPSIVVFAMTPMAIFSMAVVNPSGLVIAGGIGLWVGLGPFVDAARPLRDRDVSGVLIALSWAALVLPRRDGMVWGALILGVLVVVGGVRLPHVWRSLGVWPRSVVVASTATVLFWAATNGVQSSKLLLATPLFVGFAVALREVWVRVRSGGVAGRATVIVGGTLIMAGGAFAVMSRRAAGYDPDAFSLIVNDTDDDIIEAIGVLGWLDTPVPNSMIVVWFLGLGTLVLASVAYGPRRLAVIAGATLGIGIVTSWALAVAQSDRFAPNWQGRYYLPFLVGVPLVLANSAVPAAVGRRIGLAAAALGLVVLNVSLATMMRRFGVGVDGSLAPWNWDTYGAPVPVHVLLVIHLAASIGLVVWLATVTWDAPHQLSDGER